jgi:patatin-related protein
VSRKLDAEHPFRPIFETRHNAVFRFKHHARTGQCLTDFDVQPATIARRLAIAARASSSFPGAFEPARVTSRRPQSLSDRPPDPDDLFGIFSETNDLGFDVIDGGVLDNIPVAQAIHAIAAAPADDPVERWLLFLHPSPVLTADSVIPPGRPGALRTALTSLSIKSNQESLLTDIEVLNEHNRKANDFREVRPELLPIEPGLIQEQIVPEVIVKAATRYERYRDLRGTQAGHVIRELLEDPVGYMQHDPFPEPVGPMLKDWSAEERDALEQAIAWARREHLPTTLPGPTRPSSEAETLDAINRLDLGALWRVTDLLIDWAADVQGRISVTNRTDPRLDAAATLKRGLYEVRTIADELIRYDDYLWAWYGWNQAPPRSSRESQQTWAKTAFDLATTTLFLHPSGGAASRIVSCLRGYLPLAAGAQRGMPVEDIAAQRGGLAKEIAKGLCELETVIALAIKDGPTLVGGPVDLRQELWRYVVAMAASLAAMTGRSDSPLNPSKDAVFQVLDLAPYGSLGGMTELLASLEVLLFSVGIAFETSQPITFRQVAGTNRTPLEGLFPGGALTVKDKLAGNELANFAAFYKASWRANDWMWGRMDTAVSLIDLLARPERIRQHYTVPTGTNRAASFEALIKELVTAPVTLEGATPAQLESWERHFDDLWELRQPGIHDELVLLFGEDDGARSLERAKTALIERRHWEVLLSELPVVVLASNEEELLETGVLGPRQPDTGIARFASQLWRNLQMILSRVRTRFRGFRPGPLAQAAAAIRGTGHDPLREPEGVKMLLQRYRVGQETIQGEISTKRFTRFAADLALVSWKVLMGPSPPAPLRPLGWIITLGRHVARTVVGAPRWALVSLPVLLLATSYLSITGRTVFGLSPVVLGMVAVGIAAVFVLWMTSLSRIILFGLLFGSLAYVLGHLSGSFELRFDGRILVDPADERTGTAVRWVLGVAALAIGAMLFRLVPYVQRRWVGWASVGLAMGVLAVGRFTEPGRDVLLARPWMLVLAVIASLVLPPMIEYLLDRVRRRTTDEERRRRAASSPLGNPPFE